ncbi:hypothetical protein GCM10017750_63340 [Streptomyces racemochromogenes]
MRYPPKTLCPAVAPYNDRLVKGSWQSCCRSVKRSPQYGSCCRVFHRETALSTIWSWSCPEGSSGQVFLSIRWEKWGSGAARLPPLARAQASRPPAGATDNVPEQPT